MLTSPDVDGMETEVEESTSFPDEVDSGDSVMSSRQNGVNCSWDTHNEENIDGVCMYT